MLGPIFAREFLTLPRRSNHFVVRTVYFGAVWILAVTAWLVSIGINQYWTLGDAARFNLSFFLILGYVLLVLVLFFASLSAAGSITTEKDRRTFVLLLMTDMRNYEIVLGKLLGSLLQILLLLAGTLPIFALLYWLGGVSLEQTIQIAVIMITTALAAGSLGTTIALWRDKTFQALALTVLFLVLYLCLVSALGPAAALLNSLFGLEIDANLLSLVGSWLQPFDAFQLAVEPQLAGNAWIAPPYVFAAVMLIVSIALNVVSIWRLRAWNPRGELIQQREQQSAEEDVEMEKRRDIHAAPGRVRDVWANPILWREIRTRAYGTRPLLVKAAYLIVVGLVSYYTVAPILRGEEMFAWTAAWGLVPVGILSLLLISAQAVTAITSEKDSGAINLLLVTDLTPGEFIFGKLWGIVYNAKEFLLPPFVLAIFYGINGYLASPPELGRNMEALVCICAAMFVLAAFTIVLGIYVALRTPQSRLAIANTLGTVFFLSVGTIVCIYLIVANGTGGRFEYQWFSFVFFLAAGIGGLWWVLCAERPSTALNIASAICPPAVFYTITNILIGRPGTAESTDPVLPFLVIVGAFGFTVAGMIIPLLSEFDVAMGRTTGGAD